MKFCSDCGQPVVQKVPRGDTLPRHICESCGTIHYQNPKMVVGCVTEHADGRILLCKRSIEPRLGYWTVPAGFMENDETLEQAAARETREEALATVEILDLFAVVNVTRARQVHLFFRARMIGDEFGAGDESLEAAWYREQDIPWEEIAFRSGEFALRRFFDDRKNSRTGVHITEVRRVNP
ncbi:MAG: NUDIX hydrolase [Proteobacteria bacterium]|nr:NUDIX hydrolase [Pseudomonadota bacterium]